MRSLKEAHISGLLVLFNELFEEHDSPMLLRE